MPVGPWTSVVSYHTDPDTCGVARFSAQLAHRLGVPHLDPIDLHQAGAFRGRPLLSVKWSEWIPALQIDMARHDQLWHDEPPAGYVATGRVWKLYELGVPALVQRVELGRRPAFFTFGMAHKIDLDRFGRLQRKFPGMELWISTADHEGAGPSKVPELMRVWGPRARNLGHLTDTALALVWPHVTACVAFFEHGLRANNSSVHAALDAGKPVITNHGDQTPADLRTMTHDVDTLQPHSGLGAYTTGSPYTWDRLLRELGCAKDS